MSNIRLKGALLDDETRCVHYHSPLDVVALQCYQCRTFYPCFECHNEQEDHAFKPWPKTAQQEQAILCGVCRTLHTIEAYQSMTHCTNCQAPFNPKCTLHAKHYFE